MAVLYLPAWLHRRQSSNGNNGGLGYSGGSYNGYGNGHVPFWYTPAGLAVRYGIIAALFFIVLLFFIGGYFHAQRRIKQGKQPLAYHRWMLRAPAYTARPYPPPGSRPVYAYYSEPHNNAYQMEGYPPPPPAYHHAEASPPTYVPPPGASKAMADQTFRETTRMGESSGGVQRE